MKKQIKISFFFTSISTICLGLIYPFMLSWVALIIPKFSYPSLLQNPIEREDLFHGRPSMSGGPYSGASNLSLTSQELATQVAERLKKLSKDAPGALIPRDLLFACASAYDPDISPEAAKIQVLRIAKARNLDAAQIHHLIEQQTRTKLLGFIGVDYVNVIEINEELKKLNHNWTSPIKVF